MSLYTGTPPRVPEGLDDLGEEPATGVELLPLGIDRVIAVLADQEDAVNAELRSAQRHRPRGRAEQGDAVASGHAPADITPGELLNRQAHDLAVGSVSPLGDGIPLDELGDDVVGVRVSEIGRRDGRDPLPGAVGLRQRISRKDDPRLRFGLTLEDEVTGGIVLDGRDGR